MKTCSYWSQDWNRHTRRWRTHNCPRDAVHTVPPGRLLPEGRWCEEHYQSHAKQAARNFVAYQMRSLGIEINEDE